VRAWSSLRTTFVRSASRPRDGYAVKHWSLRSVQIKLIKIGARLARHARRLVFQLAEVARGEVCASRGDTCRSQAMWG